MQRALPSLFLHENLGVRLVIPTRGLVREPHYLQNVSCVFLSFLQIYFYKIWTTR